jgi:hypothetical protein
LNRRGPGWLVSLLIMRGGDGWCCLSSESFELSGRGCRQAAPVPRRVTDAGWRSAASRGWPRSASDPRCRVIARRGRGRNSAQRLSASTPQGHARYASIAWQTASTSRSSLK